MFEKCCYKFASEGIWKTRFGRIKKREFRLARNQQPVIVNAAHVVTGIENDGAVQKVPLPLQNLIKCAAGVVTSELTEIHPLHI